MSSIIFAHEIRLRRIRAGAYNVVSDGPNWTVGHTVIRRRGRCWYIGPMLVPYPTLRAALATLRGW